MIRTTGSQPGRPGRFALLIAMTAALLAQPLAAAAEPKTGREIMQLVDARDDGDNASQDMQMLLIDKNGNPINNAYNLMDRRATAEVQIVKDTIGDKKVFEISGNRLDDHPTLVNLMWEKRNRPAGFERSFDAV